jgi:protein tyrosine phosphatase (PTP) superfamily phosphohydrolase (DUF442 family)
MRLLLPSLVLLLALLPAAGCRTWGRNLKPTCDVPEYWAHPFKAEKLDGLVILKRNNDLYNCAQPEPEHFKIFAQMGIRTVVCVRQFHGDEKVVETLGMKYYSIPVPAWGIKEKQIVEFLRIAADPDNRPLLVYCWYGGDRSNMLTATYRVVVEGWSKDEAIREMTRGGTYFHPIWTNLVDNVRELNVDRLRRLAGIEPPDGGVREVSDRRGGP